MSIFSISLYLDLDFDSSLILSLNADMIHM